MKILFVIFLLVSVRTIHAKEFKTNSLHIAGAPQWVSAKVVGRVTEKIELKLEWKTRRVSVIWHQDHDTYNKAHSLGPLAAAVTIKAKGKSVIHIGPEVNKGDYAQILGHELVHVIFFQKYKGAIPPWLEEGFANFLSRKTKVDLNWLQKQKLPDNVKEMGHPYQGGKVDIHLHYKVSQALVEMLDDRCDLSRLLRLSVQRKIETFIRQTCGISDINAEFKKWIKKKALKVRHQEKTKKNQITVEEIVGGLHIPWGFEFLNSKTLLINEKNGQLSLFDLDRHRRTLLKGGPQVVERGQGGSLDVVKHPKYPKVPWIYITYVAELKGELTTHLGRFQIRGQEIVQFEKLLASRATSDTNRHFGSRLAFDQENFLYMSVGDRGHRPNGQNLSTHSGSILRLKEDGGVPKDNPFVGQKGALPEIWSYGHRNPQGLAFDRTTNRLWAVEHGPRGGDEINWIKKGKNYGWPTISYGKEYTSSASVGQGTRKKGMEQPTHYYDPSIAPCGMTIYHGSVFPEWEGHLLVGALKLTHLNRVEVKDGKFVSEERLLEKMSERIRHVKVGPAGFVYISTDGGSIYRIRPS